MNNVIEKVSHLLSEYLSQMQQQQCKSDTQGCFFNGFNRKVVLFMEKNMFCFRFVFNKHM